MSRGLWLNREQKTLIYKLALAGDSLASIADTIHCSDNSISSWLRRWGIQKAAAEERHKRTKHYKRRTTDKIVAAVVGPALAERTPPITVGYDKLLRRLRAGFR